MFLVHWKLNYSYIFPIRIIWVPTALFCIFLMLISKYILYRRQNVLFLLFIVVGYLVLIACNLNSYYLLFNKYFGLFLIIPGVSSIITYYLYKEKYQIRFGVFFIILGGILLLIY